MAPLINMWFGAHEKTPHFCAGFFKSSFGSLSLLGCLAAAT